MLATLQTKTLVYQSIVKTIRGWVTSEVATNTSKII